MDFSKKLKCLILFNLHHFVKHYEARKDEEPIWSGKWDTRAQKYPFVTFLTPFWEVCKIKLTLNINIPETTWNWKWSWNFQTFPTLFIGRDEQSFSKIWEEHLGTHCWVGMEWNNMNLWMYTEIHFGYIKLNMKKYCSFDPFAKIINSTIDTHQILLIWLSPKKSKP